ncbi:PREDICTED: sodium/bile acid cotransporter 5, partial [Myotis brandtii]|uniref:sodium/bile acid cotransporter 5 n=1 Tax=Myotis brandtii TaxID=109478 RepID=UPI0007042854
MIRRLFIVLLFVTLGEARKPFLSFLSTARTEILFFTKTEETVLVRSTYRDKRPNASFLSVRLQDPEMLQVVNVTRASSGATTFIIKLVAEEEGETNLTIQLWDSEVSELPLVAVCGAIGGVIGPLPGFLSTWEPGSCRRCWSPSVEQSGPPARTRLGLVLPAHLLHHPTAILLSSGAHWCCQHLHCCLLPAPHRQLPPCSAPP